MPGGGVKPGVRLEFSYLYYNFLESNKCKVMYSNIRSCLS